MDSKIKKLPLTKGYFGIEKESLRIQLCSGKMSHSPHSFKNNPYITTDFAESQVEIVTPVFNSIEKAFYFLKDVHLIILENLSEEEGLWPYSMPPSLDITDKEKVLEFLKQNKDDYKLSLAKKYSFERQMISGLHFNFSFDPELLKYLYIQGTCKEDFLDFKNSIYLKLARNYITYQWFITYLFGATPLAIRNSLEDCEGEDIKNIISIRNSSCCGYSNLIELYINYNSLEEYMADLKEKVDSNILHNTKEYYSPIRIKSLDFNQRGIEYVEIRNLDLNPYESVGTNLDTLKFIHAFLIYLIFINDQEKFEDNYFSGIIRNKNLVSLGGNLENLEIFDENKNPIKIKEYVQKILKEMLSVLKKLDIGEHYIKVVEEKLYKQETLSQKLRKEVSSENYMEYYRLLARNYKKDIMSMSYKTDSFSKLELSTQIVLKSAIKLGYQYEVLDEEDQFIALWKNNTTVQYIKQATKTSKDNYSPILIMENKFMTKILLSRGGVKTPAGGHFTNKINALNAFDLSKRDIVIKPKSTNFGIGIRILIAPYTQKDFEEAVHMAFKEDSSILIEEYVEGKEYRILVIDGEVVGILNRMAANVTGDGKRTIEKLIEEKNQNPLRQKGYISPLEKLQLGNEEAFFLKTQGLNFSYIPSKGETIYLRKNSNISTGGDSIDYTDEVHPYYKEMAIKATEILNVHISGVDMIIPDISKNMGEYSIIELNFNPALHIHNYPLVGKNRNAGDKLLKFLFKEEES